MHTRREWQFSAQTGHEAQEAEERFRTMADCAPVLIWMSGVNSLCNYFNQQWLDFTGRTHAEEEGIGWAEGIHHEDLQFALDTYMNGFNARREFEITYRLRRKDGQYRWILDRGRPRYAGGVFRGFIGSCIDITDRKRTEDELRQFADKLARTNEELGRFAYIASHDLQEPMRTIINYSQLLVHKHRAQLDDDATEILDLIVRDGQRMKLLIDDILTYARADRAERGLQQVDCAELVKEICQSLRATLEETQAVIHCDSMPVVMADRIRIAQLFQNLIGNAIKFRGKERPNVRLSAKRRGSEWIFSIKDNGIGIDMKYADRIFGIFQRLHPRTDFPGSGIGLAVCKKIVESYGGRIWVESEPGKGADFQFVLRSGGEMTVGATA